MNVFSVFLVFTFSMCTVGCRYEPPSAHYFSQTHQVSDGLSIHDSNSNRAQFVTAKKRGNALFLVADEILFAQAQVKVNALRHVPSLEDLAWGESAGYLTVMYKRIYRIGLKQAKNETFIRTMNELQSLNEPFDIYILSHGMPGILSSGNGYFLSLSDLRAWLQKFPGLRLVFLQSCFGSSLANGFLNIGAQQVIAFEGMNRNILWFTQFLRFYRFMDARDAWDQTNTQLSFLLQSDPRIDFLAKVVGIDIEDYIRSSPGPIFFEK
jgi:hypothetical protein